MEIGLMTCAWRLYESQRSVFKLLLSSPLGSASMQSEPAAHLRLQGVLRRRDGAVAAEVPGVGQDPLLCS